MRALKAAVIVMGVLILAGVAVVIATIVHRASMATATVAPDAPPPGEMVRAVLDEPDGTRIAAASSSQDRLTLQLQGGGPDRVVVVDTRAGRVVARVALAR